MKLHAPAAQRNKEPILDVLKRLFFEPIRVLEIASGSGEHAVHFAAGLPHVSWQPSDPDAASRASVAAHRDDAKLPNLLAPLELDVTKPWPVDQADAVMCINMIHIAPWEACEALFRGAREIGASRVVLYGPYRFSGVFTAPSNEEFDRSLRARNPAWGVRDLDDVTRVAKENGFERSEVVAMPANNHVISFRRPS